MKNNIWLLIICIVFCSSCTKDVTAISIIPMPTHVGEVGSRDFVLSDNQTISISDPTLKPAAEYLKQILSKSTGFDFEVTNAKGEFNLVLDSSLEGVSGAYNLSIDGESATIVAKDYQGIISGISSLRQLFPSEIEADNTPMELTLPTIEIKDSPLYQWRGMHLDVSRHFFTVDEVKEMLDIMALYKLNLFHWHLTDDQGWRIEIKKYPLLTEKGAWREFNGQDRSCQYLEKSQDNSDFAIPEEHMRINGTDTIYGGFYTQDEIRDVVKYAGVRGIDVMPEIDMPGHFMAAIANYKGVSCTNDTSWGQVFSAPICPGKESALTFCKNVYAEIFELFPYEYVHLGADEVEKSNWEKCRDCQKRMKQEGLKSEMELQAWFVKYMEKYFNDNGKKLVGWDEIIEGGLSPSATISWWRSWCADAIPRATVQGNEVIICPNTYFYFDYNHDADKMREFYNDDYLPANLPEDEKKYIKGMQANIWTETIPTRERMQHMMLPRMLVLAEKAWSQFEVQDWDSFLSRLQSQIERFNVMGLNYRIPDIVGLYQQNMFTDECIVTFDSWDKVAEIRYTTDGSLPTINSTLYDAPFTITDDMRYKVASFRRDGSRGDIYTAEYIKAVYVPATEVANKKDGLHVVWHEFKGSKAADIESYPVKGHYNTEAVSIPAGVNGYIGLIFTGYIDMPYDGVYTLELLSDDGSTLEIDGQMVIDNDGMHSPAKVKSQAALSKGLHPIELRYFDPNGGVLELEVFDSKGKELTVPVKFYN